MKISRKQIAEAAGVSVSTVGMILSGQGERYNEKTRNRVLTTAANLGYQPSINARALRLNRSLLLGVLCCEVNTHLAARFLQGIQDAIASTDYSPLVFFAKCQHDQATCLEHCLNRQVDALLVNCAINPAEGDWHGFARKLAELPIPVLEVFGHFLPDTPKVNVDNVYSGRITTQHLVDHGHQRIALVTHSRYDHQDLHFDAWEQSLGYQDALRSAGLDPMIITCDLDFTEIDDAAFLQAGLDSLDDLLAQPRPPTAAVCYNDLMAYGLNRACRLKGLAVPDAFSVSGNGGMTLSSVVNPPLTTTRPRYSEIGRTAAAKIIQAIDGHRLTNSLIAPDLVERQSTGPAPVGVA